MILETAHSPNSPFPLDLTLRDSGLGLVNLLKMLKNSDLKPSLKLIDRITTFFQSSFDINIIHGAYSVSRLQHLKRQFTRKRSANVERMDFIP